MAAEVSRLNVLVLAGERGRMDALREQEDVTSKSDIMIQGKPMLVRVLEAVAGSGLVQSCTVVGAAGTTKAGVAGAGLPMTVSHLPGADGPASSILSALDAGTDYPLLVTTSDHPLLTPDILQRFAREAMATGADLAIGFADKPTIQAAYPDVARTYFPIGGRKVSGCNLFFLRSADAVPVIEFWTRAEQDRKRPHRIAWRFGLLSGLRLIRPGVSFEGVFRILSRRLGCAIAPVMLPDAEAAIDVDKPGDLDLVRRILAARAA